MPLTRRELLKGIGVTAGAIGLGSSSYPNLIPFENQPDTIVPGTSTWIATSCRECPAGCGMVVRNREAHAVKCEGNPVHPINRGTLCARGQAALQGLYDPDRIKYPLRRHKSGGFRKARWDDAVRAVGEILKAKPRVAFISDLQTGSLDALFRQWMASLGGGTYLVYEPINYEAVKTAAGGMVPAFDLTRTDYLVSLAADFLETWISPVEYARQFARMREARGDRRTPFVYIGPRLSMTAANADERIMVPRGFEATVAYAIAGESGKGGAPAGFAADEVARRAGIDPEQIRRVARGLSQASTPLVLPGGDHDTARAALSLAGGGSMSRSHAVTNIASTSQMDSLISAMEAGDVDVLVVFSANPVYSWVDPRRLISAIKKVKTVISLSPFLDETTSMADWVLPSNHHLESWGDYSPQDGIINLMQPVMGTLFDTRHPGDILIELARSAGVGNAGFGADNFYDYLRIRWGFPASRGGAAATDEGWNALLQQGGRWPGQTVGNNTPKTGYENLIWQVNPTGGSGGGAPAGGTTPAGAAGPAGGGTTPALPPSGKIRLWTFPHIYFYDGRNANKRWLQETMEPVTSCAWSSWAEMNRRTAERIGVDTEDVIEISAGSSTVQVPVLVRDGVADDTICAPLGQGHSKYGRFAAGTGINFWSLSDSGTGEVKVRVVGTRHKLTRWRGEHDQHGRDIVQSVEIGNQDHGQREITLPLPEGYRESDFYPGHEHAFGNRWAMVVDLDRCIGCNSCVVACYAENNIAVVGADGINRSRQMAWLRIDRYEDWKDTVNPVKFQPMLCQHCDSAPCEPVCPVYAAVHSPDGLNEQIYNRCVGTRYCSNNCPWKVRRFNWFHYDWPEPLNYQLNPDVTVRDRGVMEKCTFCVQRIRQARAVAVREGRPIRPDEITPACVQTCPTRVFEFGDLMNPDSRVSKLIRSDPRAYQVLHELNTKTAVIYLKKITQSL